MKDYGWICKHCQHMQKHLKLDLQFGKRRKELTCNECGELQQRENVEKVYREREIVEVIQKNLDMLESIATDTDNAEQQVEGRKKSIKVTAKSVGLEVDNNQYVRTCIYCGETNSRHRDECQDCGHPDWMPRGKEA